MLFIPMVFMICATMSSLLISFKTNVLLLVSGQGKLAVHGLQSVVIFFIFGLALMLVVEGTKVLMALKKKTPVATKA